MDNTQHNPEIPEQRRQAEAEILRRATERPMARLHSHGSGTIGIHGATCLNLVKEPEFCVEQFNTVARCDIKYTKLPTGSTVNVFVFTGEISEDQAMRIAAILKE